MNRVSIDSIVLVQVLSDFSILWDHVSYWSRKQNYSSSIEPNRIRDDGRQFLTIHNWSGRWSEQKRRSSGKDSKFAKNRTEQYARADQYILRNYIQRSMLIWKLDSFVRWKLSGSDIHSRRIVEQAMRMKPTLLLLSVINPMTGGESKGLFMSKRCTKITCMKTIASIQWRIRRKVPSLGREMTLNVLLVAFGSDYYVVGRAKMYSSNTVEGKVRGEGKNSRETRLRK